MPSVYFFAEIINKYLHEPYASLLNGIVLGIKPKGYPDLYQKLIKTGLLHIAVLSGMNLTLLSAVISGLLKPLGRKINSMITIIVIVLFVHLVGYQAPIVRAAIMSVLTHVAIIYGRRKNTLYLLLISGLISIIFKPTWIKSLSFQLSYLATLGLILFSKGQTKYSKSFVKKITEGIKTEIRTSISAQIFTAPLIFIKFKQISLISPITNVLISPIIAPLMFLGILTAILGSINYYLGLAPALISYIFLKYLLFIIEIFSKIPYGFLKF